MDDENPGGPDAAPTPNSAEAVVRALARIRARGKSGDVLLALLDHLLLAIRAERVFLISVDEVGDSRVRASRNNDGDSVPEADRWIARFAVQRCVQAGAPLHFADTRNDRRFRTEGERDHAARIRSILVLPVRVPQESGAGIIYLDSRFNPLEWAGEEPIRPILDAITLCFELEASERAVRSAERRLARWKRRTEEEGARPSVVRHSAPEREVDFHGFRTRCPEIIAIIAELQRLSRSDLPILIEGESGTGKEV
ncbi:MAG: hypothetical protein KDC38_13810, partial [Planctomycetes bacterium]|nr:hypothetical protein [Planctomycetota bacterium]